MSGILCAFVGSSGVVTGQQAYTTPGTYSWTCPDGVTSVSVVCVGGGGGGGYGTNRVQGGTGGGLGWKNNISVTPGVSYTVVVGAGGAASTNNSTGNPGGNSYFINTSTVAGFGGLGGGGQTGISNKSGGGFVGDGGGAGGNVYNTGSGTGGNGGGGAGGYSGNGGNGGDLDVSLAATAGAGGGGGGGGYATDATAYAGAGGGVGILGEGANGSAGTSGTSGTDGGGGSGGTSGSTTGGGGLYGGGGGGQELSTPTVNLSGGGGAVRIIWGPNRAFPSTNTNDIVSGSSVNINITSPSLLYSTVLPTVSINPQGLFIQPDGTRLWATDFDAYGIYEFSMSTPWNTSTLSYVRTIGSSLASPTYGIYFRSDGLKMYTSHFSGQVAEYNLGTPWRIDTASFIGAYDFGTQYWGDLLFNDTGTKLYICDRTPSGNIYQVNVPTPWSITSITGLGSSFYNGSSVENVPQGMEFNNDGTQLLVIGEQNRVLRKYILSTAYDITTMTLSSTWSYTTDAAPSAVKIKPDGTKLYILSALGDYIREYNL